MNDTRALNDFAISSSLTTEAFAAALHFKPQSIRKRYSQTGTYYGIRPHKLPNGHLRWPSNSPELLLNKGEKK